MPSLFFVAYLPNKHIFSDLTKKLGLAKVSRVLVCVFLGYAMSIIIGLLFFYYGISDFWR